jgi:hypothetical protein
MERLWSKAVATGRNWWQMAAAGLISEVSLSLSLSLSDLYTGRADAFPHCGVKALRGSSCTAGLCDLRPARSSKSSRSVRSARLAPARTDGARPRRPSADARPLPSWTTGTDSLGARFWGQVRGLSGRLRVPSREGCDNERNPPNPGKALYQAHLRNGITAGRILHGKEGVDGSSPSEGFSREESPVNRDFLLPCAAPQSTSA